MKEQLEKQLRRLAENSNASNEKEIAIVLYTLLGSLHGNSLTELCEICCEFSLHHRDKIISSLN
ncbi:MAG: hypothetical protein ABI091_26890 [Ferruginibacter sp.]